MSKRDELTIEYSVNLSFNVLVRVDPTKTALTGEARDAALSNAVIAQILKEKSCVDMITDASILTVIDASGNLVAASSEDEDEFPEFVPE